MVSPGCAGSAPGAARCSQSTPARRAPSAGTRGRHRVVRIHVYLFSPTDGSKKPTLNLPDVLGPPPREIAACPSAQDPPRAATAAAPLTAAAASDRSSRCSSPFFPSPTHPPASRRCPHPRPRPRRAHATPRSPPRSSRRRLRERLLHRRGVEWLLARQHPRLGVVGDDGEGGEGGAAVEFK